MFTCVRINWYLVVKKTEKEDPELALNRIAFIQGDFLFTTVPVFRCLGGTVMLSSQLLTFSDDMVMGKPVLRIRDIRYVARCGSVLLDPYF